MKVYRKNFIELLQYIPIKLSQLMRIIYKSISRINWKSAEITLIISRLFKYEEIMKFKRFCYLRILLGIFKKH